MKLCCNCGLCSGVLQLETLPADPSHRNRGSQGPTPHFCKHATRPTPRLSQLGVPGPAQQCCLLGAAPEEAAEDWQAVARPPLPSHPRSRQGQTVMGAGNTTLRPRVCVYASAATRTCVAVCVCVCTHECCRVCRHGHAWLCVHVCSHPQPALAAAHIMSP